MIRRKQVLTITTLLLVLLTNPATANFGKLPPPIWFEEGLKIRGLDSPWDVLKKFDQQNAEILVNPRVKREVLKMGLRYSEVSKGLGEERHHHRHGHNGHLEKSQTGDMLFPSYVLVFRLRDLDTGEVMYSGYEYYPTREDKAFTVRKALQSDDLGDLQLFFHLEHIALPESVETATEYDHSAIMQDYRKRASRKHKFDFRESSGRLLESVDSPRLLQSHNLGYYFNPNQRFTLGGKYTVLNDMTPSKAKNLQKSGGLGRQVGQDDKYFYYEKSVESDEETDFEPEEEVERPIVKIKETKSENLEPEKKAEKVEILEIKKAPKVQKVEQIKKVEQIQKVEKVRKVERVRPRTYPRANLRRPQISPRPSQTQRKFEPIKRAVRPLKKKFIPGAAFKAWLARNKPQTKSQKSILPKIELRRPSPIQIEPKAKPIKSEKKVIKELPILKKEEIKPVVKIQKSKPLVRSAETKIIQPKRFNFGPSQFKEKKQAPVQKQVDLPQIKEQEVESEEVKETEAPIVVQEKEEKAEIKVEAKEETKTEAEPVTMTETEYKETEETKPVEQTEDSEPKVATTEAQSAEAQRLIYLKKKRDADAEAVAEALRKLKAQEELENQKKKEAQAKEDEIARKEVESKLLNEINRAEGQIGFADKKLPRLSFGNSEYKYSEQNPSQQPRADQNQSDSAPERSNIQKPNQIIKPKDFPKDEFFGGNMDNLNTGFQKLPKDNSQLPIGSFPENFKMDPSLRNNQNSKTEGAKSQEELKAERIQKAAKEHLNMLKRGSLGGSGDLLGGITSHAPLGGAVSKRDSRPLPRVQPQRRRRGQAIRE